MGGLGEAGGGGDVREAALAVVAQQGVADAAVGSQPAAAQDEDVGIAVVVVVGVHHVEAAQLTVEAGFPGTVDEAALAVVVEEAQGRAGIDGGSDHVEVAVAIEVVHQGAAGGVKDLQAGMVGDVREGADVGLRAQALGRDAELGRYAVRVLAEGHGGDVEQPAGLRVVRCAGEHAEEGAHGLLGRSRVAVAAACGDGEDAHLRRVLADAVGHLADAQEGDAEVHQGLQLHGDRQLLLRCQLQGGADPLHGLAVAAQAQQLLAQLATGPHALLGTALGAPEHGLQVGDLAAAEVLVGALAQLPADLLELLAGLIRGGVGGGSFAGCQGLDGEQQAGAQGEAEDPGVREAGRAALSCGHEWIVVHSGRRSGVPRTLVGPAC